MAEFFGTNPGDFDATLHAELMLKLLLLLLAAPQAWKAITYRSDSDEARSYYNVDAAIKWRYGLIYLVLTAFLAVMTSDLHDMLTAPRR